MEFDNMDFLLDSKKSLSRPKAQSTWNTLLSVGMSLSFCLSRPKAQSTWNQKQQQKQQKQQKLSQSPEGSIYME